MIKSEIIEFLTDNPVFHLATAYKGRPFVRALLLYRADDQGIVFHTAKMKELFRQLSANPEVELCFNDYGENIQIRVHGTVELIEDLDLKREIVANRVLLKPWVEERGYDSFAVFRLRNGVATVWTEETTFASKTFIEL